MVVNVMVWEHVLIAISNHEESYTSQICREISRIDANKNVSTIIKEFEALKWITMFKRGRMRIIKITPKGKEIAHNCRLIVNSLQTR